MNIQVTTVYNCCVQCTLLQIVCNELDSDVLHGDIVSVSVTERVTVFLRLVMFTTPLYVNKYF